MPATRRAKPIAAVQQASALEPKNAAVKLAVGRVFESRGQLDEAAWPPTAGRGPRPTWAAPHVAALGVPLRKGDAAGGARGLRALPEDLQSSAEADLLLGRLLSQKQEWADAQAALDRAVVALPGLAEAHALRGTAAYHAGDLKVAAVAYGRAVELRPDDLATLSSHGLYLSYDGRLEDGSGHAARR